MRNRRRLVAALSLAGSLPFAVVAQVRNPPTVIGVLFAGARGIDGGLLGTFHSAMTELHWKENSDYVMLARWAEGARERLPSMAKDLAQQGAVLILTTTASATTAAAKAVPKIPVVQITGSSPVARGLAATLGRPGGMVTGLTNLDVGVSEKYLEILLAAAPFLNRVGFLIDRNAPSQARYVSNAQRAIKHFRIDARIAELAKTEEVEPAIASMVKEGVQGLVVVPTGTLFSSVQHRIIALALLHRLPMIGSRRMFAEQGALLSYSADLSYNYRRAADYVDRILKGAQPGSLPIEQPTTFELVVNLKTAKALGLTMPPEIMVQATRVIQ